VVVDVDARYPVTIAHRRADEVLLQIEAPRPDVVRCAQVRAPPRPRHLSRLIVQHAVDGRRRLLDVADQPPDAEAAARERASISGLDVDARDARLVDVEERVDDQRDRPELLTGIGYAARDALAERLDVVLEASVDRSLHAERIDRAVHFDVEVVDRYAETRHGRRLIDDAEYASIGFLGIDVRIAAGNLRRRVRRLSGEPPVRDVRARDRRVEALGERAGAHVPRKRRPKPQVLGQRPVETALPRAHAAAARIVRIPPCKAQIERLDPALALDERNQRFREDLSDVEASVDGVRARALAAAHAAAISRRDAE